MNPMQEFDVSREAPAERSATASRLTSHAKSRMGDCDMPLAYHLILGMHGFWLPNDPRGSGSRYVGSRALRRFGAATKVTTQHSVAHKPHDRRLRSAAKRALKYPPVRLTGLQSRAIGRGFADYQQKNGLIVWACSLLPDHLHLVIGQPRLGPTPMKTQLKGAAVRRLKIEKLHPEVPKLFGRDGRCVFLDTAEEVWRTIEYVEQNPVKERLPRQCWSFVTPFED
jgi:REP element-mobilizing transposase RayT